MTPDQIEAHARESLRMAIEDHNWTVRSMACDYAIECLRAVDVPRADAERIVSVAWDERRGM